MWSNESFRVTRRLRRGQRRGAVSDLASLFTQDRNALDRLAKSVRQVAGHVHPRNF